MFMIAIKIPYSLSKMQPTLGQNYKKAYSFTSKQD
jgi:hypothetical protein